ncbi:MAG: PEP-CTERM sorting domain-containing protein [Verrucomicrobia bacterium]|nr:PEP-CTERM sorting domain-containing protein [Verrucomicrobiota bacterium]MCH8514022.1 PEP-CTERM sorting domain-containing protein [Kiritimatiellia bacterium]
MNKYFACGIAALFALSASAQDWTGGATSNDPLTGNWDVSGNWDPDGVPDSGTSTLLNFQSGGSGYTSTNNLTGFELNGINFSQGAGTGAITISGNPLTFVGTDPTISHLSGGVVNLNTDLFASGVLTIEAQSNGNFRMNPGNNNINVGTMEMASGRVSMRGTQNEIGSIILGENASLQQDGNNNFSTSAPVTFGMGSSLRQDRGNVVITTGGWHSAEVGAGLLHQTSTTGSGGALVSNVALGESYEFSGTIGSASGTPARTRIVMNGEGTQIISGNMPTPGSGGQITVNNGLLHFTDASTIAGSSNATLINGGTLQIDGTVGFGSGLYQVNDTGTLAGTGSIERKVILNDGATINPGSPGISVGSLATLDQTWNPGSTYRWEVQDATGGAGTGWSTLDMSENALLSVLGTSTDQVTVSIANIGTVDNWDPNASRLFQIAEVSDGIGGWDPANINLDLSEFTETMNGTWEFGYNEDRTGVFLAYTADGQASLMPTQATLSFDSGTTGVWTGGSKVAGKMGAGFWSFGGNWDDGQGDFAQIISGDETQVSFGGDSAALAYTIVLDADDGSGGAFEINRMTLDFSGGGTTILTPADNQSLRVAGTDPTIEMTGDSDFQINNLDITFAEGGRFSGNGSGEIDIVNGTVTADADGQGIRSLTKEGSHDLRFSGNSNIDVDWLTIDGGRVIGDDNRFNNSMVLEVNSGGELIRSGGDASQLGGLVGDGLINRSGNQTRDWIITVAEGEEYNFTGTIGGERADDVQIRGAGIQRFGDGATTTRGVLINQGGTLGIDGTVTGLGTAGVEVLIVQNTGTLTGSGTWVRDVVVQSGGTLSPGNSTGTLTLGDTTLNDGFVYQWEYDTGDDSSDMIFINGFLDLNDSNTENTLINLVGLTGTDFETFTGNKTLFSTTGGVSGASNGQILDWTVQFDGQDQGTYFAVVDGDNVVLAIPEPGTLMLLGIAAIAGLIGFRRRRS